MENKDDKKVEIGTIIAGISGFVLIAALFLSGVVYFLNPQQGILKKLSDSLPFPAVIVQNKNFVPISELRANLKAVRKFYESQNFSEIGLRIDFSTADGTKRLKVKEKQILNKMVEDEIIEIIAHRKNITITSRQATENLERKIKEYGIEGKVEENLMSLYGWTLDDFKEKVVKPSMYQEELKKAFAQEDSSREKFQAKAVEARTELDKKKSFSDVVQKYSEGISIQNNGLIGWFTKEQLAPEISDEVFRLGKGETSKVLESELGFHIVKLNDRKKESGQDLINISQIFVAKKTFADWLEEEMRSISVRVLLKEYKWDEEKMRIDFRDEEMRTFEGKMWDDFYGDPSLVF